MKRFVLFLFLVGVAAYLLTPPPKLAEDASEVGSSAQAVADRQVREPLSSSWGSSLQSLRQEKEAAREKDQQPLPRETAASLPRQQPVDEGAQPTLAAQLSARADQASTVSIGDPELEPIEWVRMSQAVRARGEASVSSPGLRPYPAGSKAQVVGRANGWVQLLDPATQERGWVYHSYLVSADEPTAAEPRSVKPPPVKVASPTSHEPTGTAEPALRTSDAIRVTKAQKPRDRRARRLERRRARGLFKRRKSQRAWALGPAQ